MPVQFIILRSSVPLMYPRAQLAVYPESFESWEQLFLRILRYQVAHRVG